MNACDLYKLIRSTKYNKNGLDVDWKIEVDKVEKKIRLLFQGSVSKTDWRINLQFPVKPYKRQTITWFGCKGWVKAYKSCNDIIMDAISKTINEYPKYIIEVSGHSLGGVMTIYAAEDINYRFGIKPEVITFGCPKCVFGSKTKKYIYNCFSSIIQYRNINDFVTYNPPLIGYKHINDNRLNIKFKLKELFNLDSNHHIYGIEKYYKEG